jgi:hypothetical protein
MTEEEARQVLLLQAHESDPSSGRHLSGAPARAWTADDKAWATRQAVATVGDQVAPERFVLARTAVALQRLLPRLPAAQRWLQRRVWHAAWGLLAMVCGFGLGVAIDQLGPPQRVNLLAPAVWAVVAWNFLVYLALVLPSPVPGIRAGLARWVQGGSDEIHTLWARHAAPLTLSRLALLLHLAAAALALGLIAGLYLRGLVLDYRAGWQSTFLDAPTVQTLLDALLAPARALTGIAVPDVAPLQLLPGADAKASAAPWIHLLAATLMLAVVLPRLLLAVVAGSRAAGLARRFPLPLDTPYFEGLHPLMRPGLSPTLRLLWVDETGAAPLRLFDAEIGVLEAPLNLVRSEEGDELQLHPVPPGVLGAVAVPAANTSWWQKLMSPVTAGRSPLARLRQETDAVLLLMRPGQSAPAWVEELGRPQIVLTDTPEAEPPRLSLHARHDGWLAEGRLLQALEDALPGDPRLPRLRHAWVARQSARLNEGTQLLAESLGRIAAMHQPVADEGFLARRAEAETARAALTAALEAEWRRGAEEIALWLGRSVDAEAGAAPSTTAAKVKGRLGEGKAAIVGGVVTGALAGLKADLLSGGLTMGAGLVAGGLLGALGAAGMAKGLNVVRGTDRSFAAWNEEALAPITQGLLQRHLVLVHGLAPELAQQRLAPALAAQQPGLSALWRDRERRVDNEGEAARLAQRLQPLLRQAVEGALGGPASAAP